MGKKKIILDNKDIKLLEDVVRQQKLVHIPKVITQGGKRIIAECRRRISGMEAIHNPHKYGKIDLAGKPYKASETYIFVDTVYINPVDFLRKQLEKHGTQDPQILVNAIREFLDMHHEANTILTEQAYEAVAKKAPNHS